MPRFISNSGSFQDLIVSGSRLYIASSSIFFNNLATTSQTNVLTIDASTGQLYYTASSALSAAPQTFNTSSLLTTASVSLNTIQFTKGDASTFSITINTGSATTVSTASLLTTASAVANQNQLQFTKGDGSTFNVTIASASYAVSSSYATTASFALNATTAPIPSYIATGSVTASVNVGTGNVFTVLSASINLMNINSNGNILIGTSTNTGYKLYISGSGPSGSLNANNTLFVSGSTVTITGSTNVLRVQGSGSSSPLFTVQGSQGELFSVTDSLTGSLFSVNDISGLPILDVNSDQTVKIGSYLAPGMYASTRVTANTGVTVIYSIPTASYDSAYFDYNIRSGSVGRAGQIMAMWSGSSVNYSEVSASSFGTTNTFVFGVRISGSNMILSGSAPSNGWTVKTIVKAI